MSVDRSPRFFVRATNTDLTGPATPERPSGNAGRTIAFYGPTRSGTRPYLRDLDFWRMNQPEAAEANEAIWKKIEAFEESMRITPEAAESSGALVVKNVDLHEKNNALEHQTSAFECVQSSQPEAVLRRGMELRMTITFNRPYDPSKDLLSFVFVADVQNQAKNLRVKFDFDGSGSGERYLKNKTWGARLDKDRTTTAVKEQISVLVYIPGTAVVAEWEMRIKTTCTSPGFNADYLWIYPKSIYVLFNPWSADDLVHFPEDKTLLKEYILNEEGNVFVGNEYQFMSFSWFYGQFQKDILQICFLLLRKAFGFKMTPVMADPVDVCRALSKIINSNDDEGVLLGNWSGNYSGGVSPSTWKDCVAILRQYYTTKEPVRYGQCWVFANLLTTVCRALGIPCRSLTNFSSAHDADNTCTVDRYFDEEGNSLRSLSNDSIWNFHCWNDVWIMRPDLPAGYDGWHALDATPQERSLGFFQCGPCPVAAVRKGEINIGYDTAFVFAEVNAEEVQWIVKDGGNRLVPSSVRSESIGIRISTKQPTGTALKNRNVFDYDDSFVRLDITEEYKPKEGSDAERRSVEKALRYTRFGEILFQEQAELKVELKEEDNKMTFLGQDVLANFVVTNITKSDRRVAVTMTARNTQYWDRGIGDNNIAKEKFDAIILPSGQSQTFSLKIPYTEYMKGKNDWLSLFVYGCAVDLNDDMPYSAQRPFTVSLPDLTVQGPAEAKSQQAVDVTVFVANPLPDRPLTGCQFIMTGNLELADKGDKRFTSYYGMLRADVSNVKPGEKFSISFKLKGTTTVANKTKSMKFNLKSNELRDLNGDYQLKLVL